MHENYALFTPPSVFQTDTSPIGEDFVFGQKPEPMLTRRAALLTLCAGLAACAKTATPPAGPTALPLPPKAPPPPTPPASLTLPPRPAATEQASLWSDSLLYAGWRIQSHFYTGQSRLVDRAGLIRAEGSRDDCVAALAYLKWKDAVRPTSRRLAILVHGLASSPVIWAPMRKALEFDGFEVTTYTYPSTEQSLFVSANGLEQSLLALDPLDYDQVVIVAHSLGGLLTRAALARPSFARYPVKVSHVVMLGTPNQGATLAGLLGPLARAAVTASANDLTPARARQVGPVPVAVQFGVIAGGQSTTLGLNPLLAGDDDGVVKVAETRAANMDDHLILPLSHSALISDAQAITNVRRFLQTGRFRPPRTS